jgi:hypothetical protein
MKAYSPSITAYREAHGVYKERTFICITALDNDDEPVQINFTDYPLDVDVNIENQETGDIEVRSFFGGKHVIGMDALVRSMGTGNRSFGITLSGVTTPVLDLLQGHNCREADFELHIGEVDINSGKLLDTPVCEYIGYVDVAKADDDALKIDQRDAAESTFELTVTSNLGRLKRTNPDVRTKAVGEERLDDEIFEYVEEAGQAPVLWGKEGKDGGGGGGKGGGGGSNGARPEPWGYR